jgi:prophage DNA circulation protein
MEHLKVEGHVNLIRDQKTKAILNTDINEYNNYIALRDFKKSENEKIKSIENDVAGIKNDLNDIKNLLRGLINGSR